MWVILAVITPHSMRMAPFIKFLHTDIHNCKLWRIYQKIPVYIKSKISPSCLAMYMRIFMNTDPLHQITAFLVCL